MQLSSALHFGIAKRRMFLRMRDENVFAAFLAALYNTGAVIIQQTLSVLFGKDCKYKLRANLY